MEKLKEEFSFPVDKMKVLSDYMHLQMLEGLAGRKSDLKMLPSFVYNLATGDEVGMVLSVELGGSKVRVAKIHLMGSGQCRIEKEIVCPIKESLKSGSRSELFGFVAQCIKKIEPENGIKAGFTFSYPCELSSRKSGRLVEWTKGYTATGCLGEDPAVLLQHELQLLGLNVQIVALCNDSVSTLVCFSYNDPQAVVGVVLGSGTNASYLELVSNIPKFHSESTAQKMVVNMEWGALGVDNKSVLPRSIFDEEIDKYSNNPGKQYLEKMMSGLFLGELSRLWMRFMREKTTFLKGVSLSNSLFSERLCFHSPLCTTVLLDDSEGLIEIKGILESYGIFCSTMDDRKTIFDIVDAVITRSARLMGCCLFTIMSYLKESGMNGSIGVDGSVFKFVPGYKARLLRAMKELGMDNVICGVADDGSCRGAALIAYSASYMYL